MIDQKALLGRTSSSSSTTTVSSASLPRKSRLLTGTSASRSVDGWDPGEISPRERWFSSLKISTIETRTRVEGMVETGIRRNRGEAWDYKLKLILKVKSWTGLNGVEGKIEWKMVSGLRYARRVCASWRCTRRWNLLGIVDKGRSWEGRIYKSNEVWK